MPDPKVVLVSMPWASNKRPSLGVGVLIALAKRRGFRCRALYPTFDFAAAIGADAYESIAENASFFSISEHLFAVSLFGRDALNSDKFLAPYATGPVNPFLRLRDEVVPHFVDAVAERIAAGAPDIVGFSCTFNQVFASLAVARRLKELIPTVTTLIGGACLHGSMGEAYARAFPEWLDHVFIGEADESFPDFLQGWARLDASIVDGVTYRGRLQGACRLADRCFADPCAPDFDDWFAQRAAVECAPVEMAIPFESSRGCWWGEKSHCTFCGLNNEGMKFRRKTVEQTVSELLVQAKRYHCVSFMAADNILDYRAYSTLLPALSKLGLDLRFFYEIKGNVSRDRVAALAAAGVRWIQPGVESFSDHVLQLMRKGITALQNLCLLRLAAEYGITVSYNVLVGFPGEQHDDYARMIRLISKIPHLPPPSGMATPVQVHRFSPFFNDPALHGIEGMRACAYYDHLVPANAGSPEAFAYFFERDIAAEAPIHRWLEKLNETIALWIEKYSETRKVARLGPGFIEIGTVSGMREARCILGAIESAVLILADNVTSIHSIRSHFEDASREDVDDAIGNLVESHVVARDGDRLVSVIPFERQRSNAELQAWLRTYSACTGNDVARADAHDQPSFARAQSVATS